MKKKLVVLVATLMLVVPALAMANVSNDQVLSQHIREAVAGSTDQDTASGYGVKTGHIVDAAVTTSKIADGAIANSKIAVGAVTADKISGPISADKVETYAGTKVVHTGPADGINTFNTISAAVAAAPNGTHIKIMPGTYTEQIILDKKIIFEGSGSGQTLIAGSVSGGMYSAQGTFRDITVNGPVTCLGGVTLERAAVYGDVYTGSTAIIRDSFVYNSRIYASMGVYGYDTTVSGCIAMGQANGTLDNITIQNAGSNCTSSISISGDSINTFRLSRVTVAPTLPVALSVNGNFNLKIVDSELSGTDTGIKFFTGQHNVEVTGGKVSGGLDAILENNTGYINSIFLANTQVGGNVAPGSIGTKKLVNCFDAAYNPIPNL